MEQRLQNIYFFLRNSIQIFGSNISLHFNITAGIEFGFTKVKLQINTTHQLVEKPIENRRDDCGYVCVYILVVSTCYTKVKEDEKLVDDAH